MQNQRILWGRVILYGILVEAVMAAIFIAGLAAGVMSPGMTTALALVGSFLLPLLFAASGAPGRIRPCSRLAKRVRGMS
jgi:hypothetical protein